MNFDWLHHVWFVYFVPSLYGNGPEDLLAFILVGGGLAWLGKWGAREWRGHKAKVDHIILNHPDIPDEVPGVPTNLQPKEPG